MDVNNRQKGWAIAESESMQLGANSAKWLFPQEKATLKNLPGATLTLAPLWGTVDGSTAMVRPGR
jgi:hypothetical protein